MSDSTDGELWTIADIAAFLGIKPKSARGQLSRWGVKRASTGESAAGRITALYRADEVREASGNAPGRGHRSDLDAES